MSEQLQQRVEQLEREKRWWKRLAIGFMVTFALVLAAGGIASITLAARAAQAREQALRAQEAAVHAQQVKTLKAAFEAANAKGHADSLKAMLEAAKAKR